MKNVFMSYMMHLGWTLHKIIGSESLIEDLPAFALQWPNFNTYNQEGSNTVLCSHLFDHSSSLHFYLALKIKSIDR